MRTAVVLGTNFLVGAAVLAWVLVRHGAPALELLASGPRLGLLVLFPLAVAASFTAYAWRWKVLLAGLGARPRLAALVGYRAAGQSLSSLIPSGKLGGEPLRTLLLARGGVSGAQAIAAVAVDRTLEMGGAAAFACAYALVLLRRGVPALEGALVTVSLGAAALTLGVALTVRRLRRGAGLVTALARTSGLTRLAFVRQQMDVLGAAEEEAARLIAQPQRIARAFALGLAANLLVLGEYALLLAAFGLPSGPVAVVAAVFATGAAHSLPVPAAVGALEGAELWLFRMLGHPPPVGLAVGLVVRLREVAWIVPGILYLMMRAPGLTRGPLTTPPDPCTRAPEPPARPGGPDARRRRMMRGVVVMAVALLCAVPARAQDRPLPGKKLTMMSRGARQMTVFIAKARLDTQFQPEVTGAKLRIVNPTSGESRVVDLPASGWSANAHGTVFKFKNPSAPGGSSPVKAALVKHKSGITVIAKTTGITLDEPTQGSVGLVLAFGALHYCALFGGEVVQDEPGKFFAKKAPAPAACSGSVGCGSGLIDGDEQCEEDADCGVQKQCLQCQCVGAGDVGVSLLWSDTNDLDLHVIDPSGEEITWFNRTSASGGMLDVDANPGCLTPTTMPLENVFWPVGGAPHGTYVVRVNFYALCPGGAAAPAFTVRTVVDHALTTFDGTATTPDRPCDDCGTGDSPCACVDVTSFTR